MIKWHVGEWNVREHFMQAGASVDMPLNSNVAGIDMVVNDTELNIIIP